MLDNILVSKRISGWLSVAGERKYGKSGAVSDKLREQGNIKFGAGDNMAALKLYTESVICAPSGKTFILHISMYLTFLSSCQVRVWA